MKLTEHKTKRHHYFEDEQGRIQGEYKDWHENGHRRAAGHCRDNNFYGEFKLWNPVGELEIHTFDIDGREIIDFLKNPELYPSTPEEKTMFVLKYGNAPFIGDTNETT